MQLLLGAVRQQSRNMSSLATGSALSARLAASARTTTSASAVAVAPISEVRAAMSSDSERSMPRRNRRYDDDEEYIEVIDPEFTPEYVAARPVIATAPETRSRAQYVAKYESLFAQAAAQPLKAAAQPPAVHPRRSAELVAAFEERKKLNAEYLAAKKAAVARNRPHSDIFRHTTENDDTNTEFMKTEKARTKSRNDSISRSEADDLTRAAMLEGLSSEAKLQNVLFDGLARQAADPAEAAHVALARQAVALDLASSADIRKAKTAAIVDHYKRRDGDTGSTEVQIAVLTERLNVMELHRSRHKQDKASTLPYHLLLGKRRRLLKYLQRHRFRTYQVLLRDLGLDEHAIFTEGQTTQTRPFLRAEPQVSKRQVPLAVRPVDAFRARKTADAAAAAEAQRQAALDLFDENATIGGYASFLAAAKSKGGPKAQK